MKKLTTKELLDMSRDQAAESIACQQDELRDLEHCSSLEFILRNLPAWKRWWLKKNQLHNHFRVTKLIPKDCEERPFFWVCKFQIWAKGKLVQEHRITPEAYAHFAGQPTWKQEPYEPKFFVYNNPNAICSTT